MPGALRERCRERVVGSVHSLGTPGSLNRFAECLNDFMRRGNARVIRVHEDLCLSLFTVQYPSHYVDEIWHERC